MDVEKLVRMANQIAANFDYGPDKDKIVHGSGPQAVVRVVLYDNKAHRMSGMTADSILELKATTAPFPLLLVLGGAFGVTVVALLLVMLLRGSGKKRRPVTTPSAPVVAGGAYAGTSASRAILQGASGTYTITAGPELRLGRDPGQCTIVLAEPAVSSFHATLKLDHGVFYVRDEGSNNGTFVNNAPIAARVLTPVGNGSVLRFGPIEFSVRLE